MQPPYQEDNSSDVKKPRLFIVDEFQTLYESRSDATAFINSVVELHKQRTKERMARQLRRARLGRWVRLLGAGLAVVGGLVMTLTCGWWLLHRLHPNNQQPAHKLRPAHDLSTTPRQGKPKQGFKARLEGTKHGSF